MFKLKSKKKYNLKKEAGSLKFLLSHLFELKIIKFLLVVLAILIIGPIILFVIWRPKTQNNINYGVTFSSKYAEQLGMDWKEVYLAILDDLNVKNLRLVAYWDETEPEPDQYNFENIKWQLDEAEKRDVKVIMAIGRKVPRFPECFEPQWWKNIDDEELRNLNSYEYIKEVVMELRGYKSIQIWQVENEPFWPFGDCEFPFSRNAIQKEIKIVRSLDSRPILVQDSGEGGLWQETYQLGDYLAISMYRKIWYDFWGVFLGKFIYFQYPLTHWSYKIKAHVLGVPYEKIMVTELQSEPWGPGINSRLSDAEKEKSFSRADFFATINYAQKAGFKDLYLWGAEWWYWEKTNNNNPFFWDTAKPLFR